MLAFRHLATYLGEAVDTHEKKKKGYVIKNTPVRLGYPRAPQSARRVSSEPR